MITRSCALVVALLLALTLAPAVLAPASAGKSHQVKYAAQAFKATNHRRDGHDLRELRRTKCLQKLANKQARRMARRGTIFHQDLGHVLRRCELSRAGENVGSGFRNGRAIVRGWMHSSGHRANILQRRYRLMAIAARKSHGVWYVAQVFGRK